MTLSKPKAVGLTAVEIYRKLIHLSSLIYPALYLWLDDRLLMIQITGGVLFLLVSTEISRRFLPSFAQLYNRLFGFSLREKEKNRVTGATYFLFGALCTVAMFNAPVTILALTILVISDSCASIIGLKFGRMKLIDGKSLAGTSAFILSALLISLVGSLYFSLSPLPLFGAAIAAGLAELFSDRLRLDDNILIPLSYAAVATILL